MINTEEISTVYGRPINELTKDELIELINMLANEINRLYEQAQRDRDFFSGDFTR